MEGSYSKARPCRRWAFTLPLLVLLGPCVGTVNDPALRSRGHAGSSALATMVQRRNTLCPIIWPTPLLAMIAQRRSALYTVMGTLLPLARMAQRRGVVCPIV